MDTFDPEYDAPLFYCCGCARELRRNYCRKCGTEDNTLTNWIPNGKKERPTPARDGERDEKGGERPRCACGCVDKLHDAGQPGTRRCNQPGCGCEDFISASRDGGEKGNNDA